MRGVLQELESLLMESLELLAISDPDASQLQAWAARRASIFARLQKRDEFELSRNERAGALRLIEEILRADQVVIAKIERNLQGLADKIAVTAKVRRVLDGAGTPRPPVLLQRLA